MKPEPCSLYTPSPTFPVVMYLIPSPAMSLLSIQSPSRNRESLDNAIYFIGLLRQCLGTSSNHSIGVLLYSGSFGKLPRLSQPSPFEPTAQVSSKLVPDMFVTPTTPQSSASSDPYTLSGPGRSLPAGAAAQTCSSAG